MTALKIDQTGRHVKVKLDDIEITNCLRGLDLSIDVYGHVTVTLNVAVDELIVDSLAEPDQTIMVNIPDDTADTLQLLGWIKGSRSQYKIPREPVDTSGFATPPEGTAA